MATMLNDIADRLDRAPCGACGQRGHLLISPYPDTWQTVCVHCRVATPAGRNTTEAFSKHALLHYRLMLARAVERPMGWVIAQEPDHIDTEGVDHDG